MSFAPRLWWHRAVIRSIRRQPIPLWLERLEDRTLLATFDVIGNAASYLASAGVANHLTVSQTGSFLQFTDTAESITLSAAAKNLGCTGDGTDTILCPAVAIASVEINTLDGQDTVAVNLKGMSGPSPSTTRTITIQSTGTTALTIDDSSDTKPETATLNAGSLTGLAGTDVQFSAGDLSSLTVLGGSGGNDFTVLDTPSGLATTLSTGAGNNNVNVHGTTGALDIVGNGGHDSITVGNPGPTGATLANIQGDVNVTNTAPATDLVIDDSGDPNAAQAMLTDQGGVGQLTSDVPSNLDTLLESVGFPPSFSKFVPAPISFSDSSLQSLTIRGGSGGNHFTIANTGPFTTQLDSGTGQDIVDVLGTTGALNIDGQNGRDTVDIGQSSAPTYGVTGSDLANIQGTVNITNDNSLTDLVVDDSANASGALFTLGSSRISTSVSAADITFTPAQLASLSIQGGSGGNTFDVADTPLGVSTTLTTGHSDTVNVQNTSSPLQIIDSDGSDLVTSNPGVAFQHIIGQGPLLPGSSATGTLASPTSVDVYALQVATAGMFTANLTANGGPLLGRLDLSSTSSYANYNGLLVGGGGALATSETALSLYLLPGCYYLAVSDADDPGGGYSLMTNLVAGPNPFTGLDVDPALNRTVGTDPVGVIAADFRNNDIMDLATVNEGSGTVSVLLGVGDGTFQSQVQYAVGGHPDALATVDFNNDGLLSLAVRDSAAGIVTILPGLGDGTFALEKSFTVPLDGEINGIEVASLFPAQPELTATADFARNGSIGVAALVPMVTADLSGDGSSDVATLDQSTGVVSIFPGGNLDATPIVLPVGGTPDGLAAVDFYDNGSTELAVRDSTLGVVTILGLDGSSTQVSISDPSVANIFTDQVYDSYLTAQTGYPANVPGAITTPLGPLPIATVLDSGVSVSANDVTSSPQQSPPILADLNGKNIADVVTVSSSGEILLRPGTGQPGVYGPAQEINTGTAPLARSVAVVSTGSSSELAAINLGSDSLSLYFLQADGTWKYQAGPATDLNPSQIVAGNLEGTGRMDLVVANNLFGFASLSIYHQNADGTFTEIRDIKVGTSISDVVVANINNDSHPDLLVTDADTGAVEVLLNEGLPPGQVNFVDSGPEFAGTGTYGVESSEATTVLNGLFGSPVFPSLFFPISNEETDSVAVGDFSGNTDLILANQGSGTLTMLRSLPGGTFADAQVVATLPAGQDPTVVQIGNFFGNDNQDLAVLNEGADDIWIYQGDGQGGFTHTSTIDVGLDPTGLTVQKEANRADNLVVNNAFGDVLTLLNDGHGNFSPPGAQTTLAVQPNLFGAGKPGAVVANEKQGRLTIQASDASGTQFNPVAVSLGTASSTTISAAAPAGGMLVNLENNTSYYDLVVPSSGSNSVMVYHATGVDAYDDPVSYPVADNPVSVTVAYMTGPVPDLLVVNQGSNDISVLFGSIVNGQWVGTAGQRLQSAGQAPLAVDLVNDPNSPGGFDLAITNEDGTMDILPGRGQGFFDDRDPTIIDLGRRVTQPPTMIGDIGIVPTSTGQLVGFDLANDSHGVVFTPLAGEGVDAVAALANGNLVAVLANGSVEELSPDGSGQYQATSAVYTPLDGHPGTPTALDVLENGDEVLVTTQGQDSIFVFTLLSGPGSTPGPELGQSETGPILAAGGASSSGSTTNAASLADAPYVLVVSLVADTLSGDSGTAGQGTTLAELAQQGQQTQVGGDAGGNESAAEGLAAHSSVVAPPDGENLDLELFLPPDPPNPVRPLTRQTAPGVSEELSRTLAGLDDEPDRWGSEEEGFSWRLGPAAHGSSWSAGPSALSPQQMDSVWLDVLPDPARESFLAEKTASSWKVISQSETAVSPPGDGRAVESAEGRLVDEKWLLLPALAVSGLNYWPVTAGANRPRRTTDRNLLGEGEEP